MARYRTQFVHEFLDSRLQNTPVLRQTRFVHRSLYVVVQVLYWVHLRRVRRQVEYLDLRRVLRQPALHFRCLVGLQPVRDQQDLPPRPRDQELQKLQEHCSGQHFRVGHELDCALVADRGNLVDPDMGLGHLHRRPFPLAGIARAGVVVGGHAHLVGPEDLRTLTKRLNFNGRVGLQQPLLHLVRVLQPPLPTRFLGGITPAVEILPHGPLRQGDAKLLLDQLTHRTSSPEGVRDAQGLRQVVIHTLLDAEGLVIGQQATHTERSPRPGTRQRGRAVGGVSRPPAADGFMADPEQVGEFDFRVAQLDASQGAQAQYLQRFIGQMASIR
jgi:hypothetical protein